ncbi:MAG: PilM family type IVa pilus assembly protein TapM [Candidatus Rifleibacteriota bacterium]
MNLYTDLISIDIGTSSLKLVAIDPGPSRQGYKVKRLIKAELPEGLVGGDFTRPFISDVEAFKKILSDLTRKVKNSGKGFIIGLPDRWVKLHLLTMKLSEAEKKSTEFLGWRIEKNISVPEGMEVFVDFQILGKAEEDGNEYRIMAAAVKKDIIDLVSSITTELELEVMVFDTSSLGVYNLFEDVFPDKCVDKTILNLHIGHETTVVKAYRMGTLIYERVIESAGEEFSRIIGELDSINVECAQKAKEKEKFFPETRADVAELARKRNRIEKIFGNWFRELNVTFRFFQEKYNLTKLPTIFMTGGGAQFSGLDRFLSEYFSTSCMIFNPLEEMPLAKNMPPEELKMGPAFAPCIGLLAK